MQLIITTRDTVYQIKHTQYNEIAENLPLPPPKKAISRARIKQRRSFSDHRSATASVFLHGLLKKSRRCSRYGLGSKAPGGTPNQC